MEPKQKSYLEFNVFFNFNPPWAEDTEERSEEDEKLNEGYILALSDVVRGQIKKILEDGFCKDIEVDC